MITAIGIIAAILVVIVVVFVFSRLTGLFWPGSGQDSQENSDRGGHPVRIYGGNPGDPG